MLETRDYRLSLERSRTALTRKDRPSTFPMCGREWELLPEVFAPIYSPATRIALEFLGLDEWVGVPRTGSMLEMGCGTGIIAVASALAGCDRVVAADIHPAAALNASVNAARHGVLDRVRGVHSDLFDGIDGNERFDTIFWHSNFVLAPADYRPRTLHEIAYVDPGYAAHRRFLTEATDRLTPGGSVLLHFSTRGDVAALLRIAGEADRRLRVLKSAVHREGAHEVEHLLIEVTPAEVPARPAVFVR
ncbi:class I SAM-dependent methyltransferase [Streptomyces sp. HU2014]|uniref:methyltransferase domain-containing protein n=1 Tax=Streptomyces sp. HU2014 TaxID=2939414 RepID=UPI00200F7394|nr:class I SAM-dependent methyltransferase [Streptomyces sp. HU2014]UQI47439.1 class I SAM-dependent methyltransferase [Streptomyces sp. HU2014]